MSDSARHSVVEKNQKYKMERKLREGYSGGEELRRAMAVLAGPKHIDESKAVRYKLTQLAFTLWPTFAKLHLKCLSKGPMLS